jgi:hypothetical protein
MRSEDVAMVPIGKVNAQLSLEMSVDSTIAAVKDSQSHVELERVRGKCGDGRNREPKQSHSLLCHISAGTLMQGAVTHPEEESKDD